MLRGPDDLWWMPASCQLQNVPMAAKMVWVLGFWGAPLRAQRCVCEREGERETDQSENFRAPRQPQKFILEWGQAPVFGT